MSELQILLIFGGTTALYTMFGGLMGVVVTEVLHFVILMVGSAVFMFIAVAQHGGWHAVLERIATTRPEALKTIPPVAAASAANSIELTTIVLLVLQGFFFAGSPTAGEGSTAQRFMAARNEAHAMAGQLFNCFLALTLRILPLIGIGLVALSLFWPASLAATTPAPAGMIVLDDPVHAWAELIRHCRLPAGFVGLLLAVEVAAYTSTLAALINWGGSFVINDLYRPLDPARHRAPRSLGQPDHDAATVCGRKRRRHSVRQTNGRLVHVHQLGDGDFPAAAGLLSFFLVAIQRVGRAGGHRAWDCRCRSSCGSCSIFKTRDAHPMWHGLGLLFGLSFVVLIAVTLVTPA